MNDTPIIIKSTPHTLDQWLRELSRQLTEAVEQGKEHVCITADLADALAVQAAEYAKVLVERRARSAPPGG
ncbi:hypothetical protein LCGC14_1751010 [marine sediment metagenome]|uniref:Uncharacterized protein n=1 Tax=marine sediment metagenome TaxID=412755 RepID=A0A0F9HR65_9ZZZZ